MATKDDQESLRRLVQHVARSFYDSKYIIIMDQLARSPVLRDDELASRMGLQAKELNKIMAALSSDRLVQVHRQNELKEGATRSVGRAYYYIDYKSFCDVVKWRVAEMRHRIDTTLRNELDSKGYLCPNCKATFSTLEADRLMDFTLGTFVCDQCTTSPGAPHEVVLNENAESVLGNKDRMERFNKQTRFIREGLKKSEAMMLPAFDIALWVKNNVMDPDKQKMQDGLKIAGADGKRTEDTVGIVMSVDKDDETRRREREAEAEAKRAQNVLPAWHLKSTISGDLTALGVAASSHNANGKNGVSNGMRSNADILSGLGKVRIPQRKTDEVAIVKDQKPNINHTADYYERYYADLEAQKLAMRTPNIDSPASMFEEEEQKPSIQYLDALYDSRKRSRSTEDIGRPGMKAMRSNAGTPVFSRSSSLGSLAEQPLPTPDGESTPAETPLGDFDDGMMKPSGEDPLVYVGGQPMPFSEVTQEIADERMSAEEYTAWYELVMAQPS